MMLAIYIYIYIIWLHINARVYEDKIRSDEDIMKSKKLYEIDAFVVIGISSVSMSVSSLFAARIIFLNERLYPVHKAATFAGFVRGDW